MTSPKDNPASRRGKILSYTAQLEDSAAELMHKGKKLGAELYEDGMKTLHDVEKNVEDYSVKLVRQIRKHPVSSVAIAGGLGALVYILLRLRK